MIDDKVEKLFQALQDAKTTTRELNEARAAANDVIKRQKKQIEDAIISEVEAQIKEIREEIRARMTQQMDRIINQIQDDWREKLGLPLK